MVTYNVNGQKVTINNYNTDHGLFQNDITVLQFDEKGNLWIGTNSGLYVYNGQYFRKISYPNLHQRILLIFKFNDHTIGIIDGKDEIYYGDPKYLKIIKANDERKNEFHYFNKENSTSKNDSLSKLAYWEKFVLRLRNNQKNNRNNINIVRRFLAIKNITKEYFFVDNILVANMGNNKNYIFYENGVSQELRNTYPKDIIDEGFFFQTDQGTFCLFKNQIIHLTIKNDSLLIKVVLDNVSLSKKTNSIISGEYNELTGNFYFGSYKLGLYEVIPQSFQVIKHKNKAANKLIDKEESNYYNQTEISPGQIFVNNYMILNKDGIAAFKNVKTPYIRALNFKDKHNRLLYADQKKITIIDSLKTQEIYDDTNCQIWSTITTFDDDDTYLGSSTCVAYFHKDKLIRFYNKDQLGLLTNEYINFLFTPKNADYFLILTNRSIYKYFPKTKKIQKISHLPEADYRIIQELKDGYYFIGTYGDGYYILKNDTWHHMPEDKSGYLKFSHTALCDDNGHIWISTNYGMFRTRLMDIENYLRDKHKDLFYYYYEKSSGFLTNEFNGGCQSPAIKLSDGRFSYSTIDGLVQFDPLSIPSTFPKHSLNIENLWFNDIPQGNIPDIIRISQDIREIKFEINTTYYGNIHNLILQYRIDGTSNEWKNLTDFRYITLQNLNYGSYKLHIRSRSGLGSNDFTYLNQTIEVLPYTYQTWWFKSIIGVFICLSFIYLVKFRTTQIKIRNTILEKMVAEKNSALISTNQSLTKEIKMNEMFHAVLMHDLKTPLTMVEKVVHLLKKHNQTITQAELYHQLESIENTTGHINNTINHFLTIIKEKNNENITLNEPINIFDLFTKVQNNFYYHTKIVNKQVSLELICDSNDSIHSNFALLNIILHNLLDNSLKYTETGKITLYFETKDQNVIIGCKDTGQGMPLELISQIVSRENIDNQHDTITKHMGYFFIYDALNLLNGRIDVDSKIDEGTEIKLIF